MFLVVKIIKNWHFLTPLPPTTDYVIYEWSLRSIELPVLKKSRLYHLLYFLVESKTKQNMKFQWSIQLQGMLINKMLDILFLSLVSIQERSVIKSMYGIYFDLNA